MPHDHRYLTALRWSGSTAVGYRTYPRAHRVSLPPTSHVLSVSADASFRGDPALTNPEQLLLAAASSCQLLSYLALAARADLDVVAYDDDAEAVMPLTAQPLRITQVLLRPRIVLAPGSDVALARDLVDRAHEECFIARSLSASTTVEATVVIAGGAANPS